MKYALLGNLPSGQRPGAWQTNGNLALGFAARTGVTYQPGKIMVAGGSIWPQAVGTTRSRRPETVEFLRATVEELKASGFVSSSLARSGQGDAAVAPPA